MIETERLMPWAVLPQQSRGRLLPEDENVHRSPHQRDRDRILHSAAFRKLMHKTQVFVAHEGDYYRTRLTHSLEVAQIARSAARTLRLNEDLAEAVALAHDLGHTPFGHAGEDALNAAMVGYDGFDHNAQALRVVTRLERRYARFDGLNLTWETLEGLVKHNGPLVREGQSVADLPFAIRAVDETYDLELQTQASIEAQLAALADDIAYNVHDLDDGLQAGFFTIDEVRELPLVGPLVAEVDRLHPGIEKRRRKHEALRRLFAVMVEDMLTTTTALIKAAAPDSAEAVRHHGKPLVAFSPEIVEGIDGIRTFLFKRMYRHFRVNRMTVKAQAVIAEMFPLLLGSPNLLPEDWARQAEGLDERGKARLVADYIAGMTDRYALDEHRRLTDPYATA